MKRNLVLAVLCVLTAFVSMDVHATFIDFEDVDGSFIDITNQYAGLGLTLNAIDNPFPLAGIFPASPAPPVILGGAQTWIDPFSTAPSPTQIAVGSPDGSAVGILMTFAFDVDFVSLIGVDAGGVGGPDDESVTLTAWDAAGNLLGQTFSNVNIGDDLTPGSISLANMRFVAFNFTDTEFGFYGMDNLEFTPQGGTVVPEPATMTLMGLGLAGFALRRSKMKA